MVRIGPETDLEVKKKGYRMILFLESKEKTI